MRILNLAGKDLSQVLRDWKSGLFLLVMPLIFTVFFGFVFGSSGNDAAQKDTRLPVGVIDRDHGMLAADLNTLLTGSEVIRPTTVSESDAPQASKLVADGKLAALIIIPSGYTEQLLSDQPTALDVVVDQNQPSGQTAYRALETVTARLTGAVEAAHISLATAEKQQGLTVIEQQRFLQDNVQQAIAAWQQPPLTVAVMKATGTTTKNGQSDLPSGFTQASPGMMVQFAVFGLITSAMVLVMERKSRTLQRLLTTPMTRAEVIAGHLLAMFVIVLGPQIILLLLGQRVFGVNYVRQPLAILSMVVVLALWSASLGLLISAISRKEDQVITLSLIAMFVFAALGGAWFPLEVAGKTFATIGHVMPTAWAMDGFQNILTRGLGFNSVLLPAGMLLTYAAAFFGLAVWRFRFE